MRSGFLVQSHYKVATLWSAGECFSPTVPTFIFINTSGEKLTCIVIGTCTMGKMMLIPNRSCFGLFGCPSRAPTGVDAIDLSHEKHVACADYSALLGHRHAAS